MIVKKIKRSNFDKPKAWQIGDLVDYIRAPHNANAHEKIAHAGSRNFISGTHTGQKAEMIALAQESIYSKMPVTHWVFSWRESEQPTRAQTDEVVNIFLEQMGLSEHQAIYGLHHDTDNFHLHIAVNRMHPYTLKVVRPNNGFDIEVAHKVVALVEQKHGWGSEENTRYIALENGEVVRACKEKRPEPRPEAKDFERATGEKSAQRIAQERGHAIIKNAASWEELHQKLAEQGLRFEKKGSGAIVFVGDIAVKASSVDRAFGMGNLCKRLGDFVPAPEAEEKRDTAPPPLAPEPVSAVNREEWRQYQQERAKAPQPDSQPQEAARIEALRQQQRQERQRILPAFAKLGLSMLNIARHFLKLKQREEGRQARAARPRQRRGKPSFEAWLRDRGLHEQADRWRYRGRFDKAQTQPPPQAAALPSVPTDSIEAQHLEKYLAAINADRIRVTCLRMEADGSRKGFILDKKSGATTPSGGFTPQELRARMPEMLRLQRRGENIYYTPLSEKRHHILIDDMSKKSVEKLYADGFRPAVVLQSSPGNYQCVLTIPKLQGSYNREVGNRLTERLNKEYGDPKLSGAIHPHRAPGFANRKPQHQLENGKFPRATLSHTEKRECTKAFELSRRIEQEVAAAEAQRRQTQRPAPMPTYTSDTTAAYFAHFEDVRKNITIEDFSRVDAMIAVRLRANGHSPQAVAEALIQCAPIIRHDRPKKEYRNWQRYAERTTAYAFGIGGDMALAKNERLREHWQKIEDVETPRQEQQRMRLR